MTIVSDSDIIRLTYQSAEALFHNPPIQSNSELIARVIRLQIAIFDGLFLFERVNSIFGDFARFVMIPLRLAAVAQGIYSIIYDPTADRQTIKDSIILNSINIASLAAQLLSKTQLIVHPYVNYASFGLDLIDTAYRARLIYINRTPIYQYLIDQSTAISNYISDKYSTMTARISTYIPQQVKDIALKIDSVARFCLCSVITFAFSNILVKYITMILKEDATSRDFFALGTLIAISFKATQTAIHEICDNLNVPQNFKRKVIEFVASTIIGISFSIATAKGAGMVSSLSSVFKTSSSRLLHVLFIASTIGIITIALQKWLRKLGLKYETINFLLASGIGTFVTLFAAGPAAVGLGLVKTSREHAKVFMLTIQALTNLTLFYNFVNSLSHIWSLDPPSWRSLMGSTLLLLGGFYTDDNTEKALLDIANSPFYN